MCTRYRRALSRSIYMDGVAVQAGYTIRLLDISGLEWMARIP